MSNILFFFIFFSVQTIGSAVVILFTRNVMYAVTALLSSLLGVAALFVLAGADVLGVIQIIVYIGGVLVLTLFGVMYTYQSPKRYQESIPHKKSVFILIPLLFVLVLLVQALPLLPMIDDPYQHASKVEVTGMLWLTEYLPIFEWIGFLLLVVLIGAGWIGSTLVQEDKSKGEQV
ncbi:MAG: NADH-quinone oxidoreductase subunit J [Cytophagaceae bacterium]|jgi:NADH-quinone oxidoreductase subunit J|nr:NADH-quinone oxidoreductase subunit J [Cytophagaceae bacterium]